MKESYFIGITSTDDITYCCSKTCKRKDCGRNYANIDWNTKKHRLYGASTADFTEICADFDPFVKPETEVVV